MKTCLFVCAFLALAFSPFCGSGKSPEIFYPPADTSLPDPSRYPFSAYSLISIGPTFLGFETGYRNMYRLLQNEGLKPEKARVMYQFAAGVRYQRLFGEISISSTFGSLSAAAPSSRKNARNIGTEFSHVGVNLGYALYQDRNLMLVLRGGLEVIGHYLLLTDNRSDAVIDFGRLGAVPEHQAWPVFRHTGPAGHISLELLNGRAKKPSTLAITQRIGYQFGLDDRTWTASGGQTINAPSDRAGTLYITTAFWLARNVERKTKIQ